jgi:hypothetical protein
VSCGELSRLTNIDDRNEVRWLLERWLSDITELKKDRWRYAYTTLGALVAIVVGLLSIDAPITSLQRFLAIGADAALLTIWAASHHAVNGELAKAREGKDRAYELLGEPLRLAKPDLHFGRSTVSIALAIAVIIAAVTTMSVALFR